jgi:Domain of unknown function (DUF5916)
MRWLYSQALILRWKARSFNGASTNFAKNTAHIRYNARVHSRQIGQVFAVVLGVPLYLAAQSPAPAIDYNTARFSRVVKAVQIDGPITMDGRLSEDVWALAQPARDFTQGGRSPSPGQPASQQTEVRFLYDLNNLYIGAICYEKDVKHMIVNGLKRDFQSNVGDEVGIALDTLNDDRSGIFVSTNPAGAKRDLQMSNDSQINQEWDGVWDVRVRVEEDRWVAEFVIPFKTLRFSESSEQEWGLNMFRKIRRVNEESHWAPLPIRYNMTKISLAGTLTGLEGIHQGRNLKVKPYVAAGVNQVAAGADGLAGDGTADGGLDLKYGLTPSLTLDATYRTDFSQAEVDQDQVNLTRFNLFFPEKREFFLENSAVFDFGTRSGASNNNLLPFFSRRIGLNDAGTVIPIIGGARVSGTVGRQEIGFLAMKTKHDGNRPGDTFVVGRVRRDLLRNSFIGAIITSRDSTQPGDYNRVYGTDAVFQFYNKIDLTAYYLKSVTPNVDKNDDARKFSLGYKDNVWSISGGYEKVGDNFNPELGFIRREDNSHYSGDAAYNPRVERVRQIRDYSLSASYDYYAGVDGHIETRTDSQKFNLEFSNSATLTATANQTLERLKQTFTRYAIPPGDYHYRDYTIGFNSDRSRLIGGRLNYNWGDFWNGTRKSPSGDVTFKPNYHWQIDGTWSRNDIQVPSGRYLTTLVGMKVLYAFSSRAFLNTFLQYNAERHQFSSNIRFNIIHHPLSDLYIVFNEHRDTLTGQVLDRGIIFKLTNLFNF